LKTYASAAQIQTKEGETNQKSTTAGVAFGGALSLSLCLTLPSEYTHMCVDIILFAKKKE
jgi:hypothetical protein